MSNQNHYEIERKFLIEFPDETALSTLPNARVCDITQTYLLCETGERRVRRWEENGTVTYYTTFKKKTGALRRIEIEEEISESQYNTLLASADPTMHPLRKRRYTIPYGSHVAEIDIYPFFTDRAILEIELSAENEIFSLPDFLTVIREVTDEPTYKNPVLAKNYSCTP